jgi:CHAT domain-containing protein
MPAVANLVRRWQSQIGKFTFGQDFTARHSRTLGHTARMILRGLHDALLLPLDLCPEDQNLLIVPHRLLHGIPFHALHDGYTYITEQHGVSYVPSAGVLRYCLADRERHAGAMLVIGVPDERAPSISSEVRQVAALFPGSVVLEGAAATSEAFTRHCRDAQRVHLASHAVFRPDNPAFSAIRLADRWLTLPEIYDLDMCAELVTLSGCDTGMVHVGEGDEVIGLIRGFLYAGTPTVVASLWAADDSAATSTMISFYTGVRDGLGPRDALRAAQCRAIEAGMHPYFWAPFIAFGHP